MRMHLIQAAALASLTLSIAGMSRLPGAESAGGVGRVFDPPRLPEDRRLGKPRDLNGYSPWTPITDPAAWRERAQAVRERILVAAGLWPMPDPAPLQAVIHSELDRGDYTIAKVHFLSYPGFYVTGNLYRPKGNVSGRRPAVIYAHGHWQNGRLYERSKAEAEAEIKGGGERTPEGARFHLQAPCAQLARMGCIVFFYDMVGVADSTQIGHGEGFRDAEAELRLQSAFGLQTYDSIRALDFVSGLSDVDPRRIGMTGASGGGTQTFILCGVDDRPAAAFPAVMVSTAMQGGCVCENASHLRVGTGNIEFAALCAPRPLGMTGAHDWTLEIESKGLPELKALYGALGVPDLVSAKCFPHFEHNYNQVSRELMYSFMNRHLKLGLEEPVREQPFQPVPPKELSVFDDAHPRPAGAVDAAGLRRQLTEASDRQMAARRPRDAASLAEWQRVLGPALRVMIGSSLPRPAEVKARWFSTERGSSDGKAFTVEKLSLSRAGSGEEVPAVLLIPDQAGGEVVVAIHPDGKAGAIAGASGGPSPLAARLLARGARVLAIDPLLTGEFNLPGKPTAAPPVNRDYAGYTFGYNRALLAERVHDILTAVAFARDLPGAKGVSLAGLGRAGVWALLARGIAGPAVDRAFVSLDRFSFEGIKETADAMMLPGALKYGGVPGFAAAGAPLPLWAVEPPKGLEIVTDAYRAAGAADRLRIDEAAPEADALAGWLTGN